MQYHNNTSLLLRFHINSLETLNLQVTKTKKQSLRRVNGTEKQTIHKLKTCSYEERQHGRTTTLSRGMLARSEAAPRYKDKPVSITSTCASAKISPPSEKLTKGGAGIRWDSVVDKLWKGLGGTTKIYCPQRSLGGKRQK